MAQSGRHAPARACSWTETRQVGIFVWVFMLRCAGRPWSRWSEHIREINNFFIYYLDSRIPSEDERRANVPKKEGT